MLVIPFFPIDEDNMADSKSQGSIAGVTDWLINTWRCVEATHSAQLRFKLHTYGNCYGLPGGDDNIEVGW